MTVGTPHSLALSNLAPVPNGQRRWVDRREKFGARFAPKLTNGDGQLLYGFGCLQTEEVRTYPLPVIAVGPNKPQIGPTQRS